MSTAIFTIIIIPLVQILEACYTLFYNLSDSEGISIIGLSFVVTICTLPLYVVAERWQQTERDIQAKMKSQIARIKSTFSGDEQYMILTAYYRENHYHPLMALRSSISLLIQIPFFMAAYYYLSNFEKLRGVSFFFIKDLGFADKTFSIGNFPVNVLPIAMTLINIIAGAIYSKGHGKGEKIQIYVSALVFLALLYNSPAGLVVYWTMNNVLSLVKNIFYKIPGLKKVLVPFKCAGNLIDKFQNYLFNGAKKNSILALFTVSSILLIVLSSITIPSMLMESEVMQYCYVEDCTSPFVFIRYTFYQAIGLFLVWPLCFYFLFSERTKKTLAFVFSMIAICSIVNCFAFSGNYGPILPELLFMNVQKFSVPFIQVILNLAVMILLCLIIIFITHKKHTVLIKLYSIILVALAVLSGKNIAYISGEFNKMPIPQTKNTIDAEYHLSKTEKNVIVIMQDRLFAPYIEPILENHPELKKQLEGFKLYNNTVSFGYLTMIGTPGIFGGYEYTPFEINRQENKTLQQKHNEALLSLPKIFNANGFSVSVSGLPYENYLEYPLSTMYENDPYIIRKETRGKYSNLWYNEHGEKPKLYLASKIKRNFIWFSIFKMASPVVRKYVYHDEYWSSYDSYADGFPCFIDNYAEMYYLPKMIETDGSKGALLLLDNEATHEPVLINEKTFTPSSNLDFENTSELTKIPIYTTTVAIMKTYAELVRQLKELKVYDNTRIIIVSDHGTGTPVSKLHDKYVAHEGVSATLLVKDFNSSGPVEIDNTFMTNADTPWLATKDIIDNACNPFTGNPFKVENKNEWIKISMAPAESTRIRNKTKFNIKDDQWLTVHDDIFKAENWSYYNPN